MLDPGYFFRDGGDECDDDECDDDECDDDGCDDDVDECGDDWDNDKDNDALLIRVMCLFLYFS